MRRPCSCTIRSRHAVRPARPAPGTTAHAAPLPRRDHHRPRSPRCCPRSHAGTLRSGHLPVRAAMHCRAGWSARARPGPGRHVPAAGRAGTRRAGAGCAPARPARTSAVRPAAVPAARTLPTPDALRHAPAAPARTARAPAGQPWRSAPARYRGNGDARPGTAWRPSAPAFPGSRAATTAACAGHARCWPPVRAAAGPAGATAAIAPPGAAPSAHARVPGSPVHRAHRAAVALAAAVGSARRCRRPGCVGSGAAADASPSRTPPARPAGRGFRPASPTTMWCSTGCPPPGRRPASAGVRPPAPRTHNRPGGPARSTVQH